MHADFSHSCRTPPNRAVLVGIGAQLAANEGHKSVVSSPHVDRSRRQEYATRSNTQHDLKTDIKSCFTYVLAVSIGKVARQSPTTTPTSPFARGSTKSGRSPVRTPGASRRCEFALFFRRERQQRSVRLADSMPRACILHAFAAPAAKYRPIGVRAALAMLKLSIICPALPYKRYPLLCQ